jgi:hypothetical protein
MMHYDLSKGNNMAYHVQNVRLTLTRTVWVGLAERSRAT